MQISKLLQNILLSLVIITFSFTISKAFEPITPTFDKTLAQDTQLSYAQPSRFLVTQITTTNQEIASSPLKWIDTIYYYTITRLGFLDVPFNYFLDESGNIYTGHQGGEGVIPQSTQQAIIIGYLSNSPTLTPAAQQTLKEFFEDFSYKYGISQASCEVVKMYLNKTEGQPSQTTTQTETGTFSQSVKEVVDQVTWSQTEHLDYKLEILSVENNPEAVVGTTFDVKVKIKNQNTFNWFTDKTYLYIKTSDGSNSTYSVNGIWDSFSTPIHIENEVIPAGEEKEIIFKMKSMGLPSEVTQSFVFEKVPGQPMEGSNFDVKFSIIAGDKQLVQVVSPEYGFANVRECRWYSCEVLETIDDGQIYILNREEEGWYIIEYEEGKEGWVFSKYMKKI